MLPRQLGSPQSDESFKESYSDNASNNEGCELVLADDIDLKDILDDKKSVKPANKFINATIGFGNYWKSKDISNESSNDFVWRLNKGNLLLGEDNIKISKLEAYAIDNSIDKYETNEKLNKNK